MDSTVAMNMSVQQFLGVPALNSVAQVQSPYYRAVLFMTLEELACYSAKAKSCYCPNTGHTVPYPFPYLSGSEFLGHSLPRGSERLSPCVSLMVTDRSADEICLSRRL